MLCPVWGVRSRSVSPAAVLPVPGPVQKDYGRSQESDLPAYLEDMLLYIQWVQRARAKHGRLVYGTCIGQLC